MAEYIKTIRLSGFLFEDGCTTASGGVSYVFTNFYVDHSKEPLEALLTTKRKEQRIGFWRNWRPQSALAALVIIRLSHVTHQIASNVINSNSAYTCNLQVVAYRYEICCNNLLHVSCITVVSLSSSFFFGHRILARILLVLLDWVA